MMSRSRLADRIETWANALTVLTLAVLCAVLILQARNRANQSQAALDSTPNIVPPGSVLDDFGTVSDSKSQLTLLIGLRSTCRYCDESMPSLQELNAEVQGRASLALVAIGTEDSATLEAYLEKNSLYAFRPVTVRRGSPLARVVAATPSIVIVDAAGKVIHSWVGLVTKSRLTEIIDKLNNASRFAYGGGADADGKLAQA